MLNRGGPGNQGLLLPPPCSPLAHHQLITAILRTPDPVPLQETNSSGPTSSHSIYTQCVPRALNEVFLNLSPPSSCPRGLSGTDPPGWKGLLPPSHTPHPKEPVPGPLSASAPGYVAGTVRQTMGSQPHSGAGGLAGDRHRPACTTWGGSQLLHRVLLFRLPL